MTQRFQTKDKPGSPKSLEEGSRSWGDYYAKKGWIDNQGRFIDMTDTSKHHFDVVHI